MGSFFCLGRFVWFICETVGKKIGKQYELRNTNLLKNSKNEIYAFHQYTS